MVGVPTTCLNFCFFCFSSSSGFLLDSRCQKNDLFVQELRDEDVPSLSGWQLRDGAGHTGTEKKRYGRPMCLYPGGRLLRSWQYVVGMYLPQPLSVACFMFLLSQKQYSQGFKKCAIFMFFANFSAKNVIRNIKRTKRWCSLSWKYESDEDWCSLSWKYQVFQCLTILV